MEDSASKSTSVMTDQSPACLYAMSKSALHATHLCTLLLVLVKGLSFTHVLIVDRFVMHCIICKAGAKVTCLTPMVCDDDDSRVGNSAAVKDMYISHMISMHGELMSASAHMHLLLQADHMPSLKSLQSGV